MNSVARSDDKRCRSAGFVSAAGGRRKREQLVRVAPAATGSGLQVSGDVVVLVVGGEVDEKSGLVTASDPSSFCKQQKVLGSNPSKFPVITT